MGGETHRVVNLNRTQSAVGEIKTRKKSARHRFYSENNYSASSSQSAFWASLGLASWLRLLSWGDPRSPRPLGDVVAD